MTRDESQRLQVLLQKFGGTYGAILMIDAVETITPNIVCEPFVRPRVYRCRQRHLAMETCIEDGDLRNIAEQLANGFDAFELGAVVEWSKLRSAGNAIFHARCDTNRLFVLRPTVHD